jgi:two-component system, NarL family, nitrate/nitrite response regulator NarL
METRFSPHIRPAPEGQTRTETIAISIVSRSLLLRDGLVSLLSKHLSLTLVGTYTGELNVTADLPNPPGHVVLLDSGIGRDLAMAQTRQWRSMSPPARVLVLELNDDVQAILDCIEAGAGGYTLQGASPADVATAIMQIRRGEAICTPQVTAQLFARLEGRKDTAFQPPAYAIPLTPRELEVLNCLAKGMSNKEIAAKLVIELYTVKHHVHHILEKLSVTHRWDAVRYARAQGWFTADIAYPLD